MHCEKTALGEKGHRLHGCPALIAEDECVSEVQGKGCAVEDRVAQLHLTHRRSGTFIHRLFSGFTDFVSCWQAEKPAIAEPTAFPVLDQALRKEEIGFWVAGTESILIDLGQAPTTGFGQPHAVGLEHLGRNLRPFIGNFEGHVAVVDGDFADRLSNHLGWGGQKNNGEKGGGQHRQGKRYHLGGKRDC